MSYSISLHVPLRSSVILVVALAVMVGGSVGTSNGLVVCIDADGHLAVEPPHMEHAHRHAEGADHAPHDPDPHADHGDLHGLISDCSDSLVTVQKLETSSVSLVATQHYVSGLAPCLHATPATGVQPLLVRNGSGGPAFPGGTAHPDLASLRSIVLLA